MSSLSRNTLFDAGSQAAVMVISLGVGIFLARQLGDEGRGQYIYATALAGQLLYSMTNFGMELAASAMVGRDRKLLSEVHTAVLMACALIGVVLSLLSLPLQSFMREVVFNGLRAHAYLAILFALPFWIYQGAAYGILVGLGEIKTRSLFDLIFNVVQNSAIVALLVGLSDADPGMLVQRLTLAYYLIIIVGAFALWAVLIFRGARWRWPAWPLLREFFRFGFWVYVANLGSNISQRADQYAVQRQRNDLGVFGVYSLAASLAQRTQVFPQALTRSTYGRLSSSELGDAARLTGACFRQILILGLVLLLAGSLAAPLLPLIYTQEFAAVVFPFILFLVGRLFSNGAWMIANYFTAHRGRPIVSTIATWAIIPVQVALVVLALQFGGLTEAAAASALSQAILLGVFLALFLRDQKVIGLKELFRLSLDDARPWLAAFRRKS